MDAVTHLFEDAQFRDEAPSGKTQDTDNYDYLTHNYTQGLPETFGLLRMFREVLDAYNSTDEFQRVMFTEAYDPIPDVMKYYGNKSAPIAHFPFNFELVKLSPENVTGTLLNETANRWMSNMPEGGWANWVLGN